jgi:hypothetical protein
MSPSHLHFSPAVQRCDCGAQRFIVLISDHNDTFWIVLRNVKGGGVEGRTLRGKG